LLHDGAKVAHMFSSGDSSKEFGFSGAGGSDGLSFAATGDCATTQQKCTACGRTPVAQIVGMGGVQVTDKLQRIRGRE